MKRIYIAGPMTGLPDYNFPAFNEVAARLRAAGHRVENPAENGAPEGERYVDYLRRALAQLLLCEEVRVLPGWQRSRGASLEVRIAQTLEMPVIPAEDEETTT